MPFFAVFDPSTLRINIDLPFLGSQEIPAVIQQPLYDGLNWDGESVNLPINWKNSTDQDLYVQICSAIWHEKRHFLDYILTNYGQFELRLYFQIYANILQILDLCQRESLPLVAPISVLRDKVRRKALKIDKYDFKELSDVANSVHSRAQLLAFGTTPTGIGAPAGIKYSAGAKAQLEALGFYCQTAAIQAAFGKDSLIRWQERLGAGDWKSRYRWPELLLFSHGIDVRVESSGPRRDSMATDATLITALLVASLTTRAWNQESTVRGEQDKYPAGRLWMLCESIAGHKSELPPPGNSDPRALWALVNRLSTEIFGRSISESSNRTTITRKDLSKTRHTSSNCQPSLCRMCTDCGAQ